REAGQTGEVLAGTGIENHDELSAFWTAVFPEAPTGLVLDLACGLGYSTAILSELAKTVIGVEPDPSRVELANAALAEVGAGSARVINAPLIDGQADEAPFDCILVNGAVQTMPESLLDQLKDGGRLAAVLMDGQVGRATEWRRHGNTFASRPVFDATTAVLPGFERPAAFVF
ncbi:MAG: methyltransferase domain-containing protein, partial [Pseudomonadota bacterium]